MKSHVITRLGVAVAAAALLLAGCSAPATEAPNAPVPAPGEVGFEEFPIGDPIEVGPLNVAGVYFQPVDMDPPGMGLPAAESDMHMEADVSALADNGLGYGAGDFVPELTVDYEITDAAGKAYEGTFMPMNASDGPHYGANLKLGDAGTYKVKFIIHSPAENGGMVHTDKTTGVEDTFWETPLEVEWDFNYVPREW